MNDKYKMLSEEDLKELKYHGNFADLMIYSNDEKTYLLDKQSDGYKVYMSYSAEKENLNDLVEKDNPSPACVKDVELEALVKTHSNNYCCFHSTLSKGCRYMRIKNNLQECAYYTRFKGEKR